MTSAYAAALGVPRPFVPTAPVQAPAPGRGSLFVDVDDNVHVFAPQPNGRLAYTRNGTDVFAAVRAVAARHLP